MSSSVPSCCLPSIPSLFVEGDLELSPFDTVRPEPVEGCKRYSGQASGGRTPPRIKSGAPLRRISDVLPHPSFSC